MIDIILPLGSDKPCGLSKNTTFDSLQNNSKLNSSLFSFSNVLEKVVKEQGRVLRFRLLNKVGIFCNLCANGLVAEDLAVAEGDGLK